MSLPVQDEAVATNSKTATIPRSLPVPLAHRTYRSLSKQDLRRIRLEVDLAGRVEVLVPDDLRTPEALSMARFAKMYLEEHFKVLLAKWENRGRP